MKLAKILTLLVTLLLTLTTTVAAEDTAGAAQSVEALRLQLLEVESREAELQTVARQLDEDLKPENIERAFAGVGSTRPEELRESRRRQLTIQRDGVQAQLKLLATSRDRLESVIRTAEAEAYQQSADGVAPLNQMFAAQKAGSLSWRFGMLTGLMAVLGVAILIGLARRGHVSGK